ncbi:hypothetical protein C8R48DRAFT_768471 [Suillus tomentosus]|nr:hypothetical protein C8R48DRAFT_768471 [Suillus tomentosus]
MITPNISLQHLYADVKAILQSVEASLEEQKKISKDLNDLSTTINILEGVLCGNVGPGRGKRKKRKKKKEEEIMDLDTLQSEGGIVRWLATIDGAINHLLARLDTASQEPLPATAPPQGLLKFRPFPFVQHSSETLAPAVYPFTRLQKYNHRVQRNSSSPENTESQASPDSTISPGVFNHVLYPAIAGVSSCSATPATLRTRVPINGPDLSSPLPTPSPETPLEESFSRVNDSNSRSWMAPQPRRDTTSLRTFPNSLLNPISPSSTNPIHKPTHTSTLSALRPLDHKSNPASSNFTHTVTLPSTSSTSGSSAYDASFLVSRIAPIAPTASSSSLSSSACTANMHLASPPTTPTSTLA